MDSEAVLVERAVAGDEAAIAQIVRGLQDPLYRLALRMTGRPTEAEDATQEILLRVLGHLGTWRAEAKLLTWAYRVGVNYLINLRRQSPQERAELDLAEFADRLADGLAIEDYRGPDAALLSGEVRLQCSQAMLQCLVRDERIAFVLGDVFELDSTDAAYILGVTPAAYRKRLQRAKKRIGSFLDATCGIANPQAVCRCSRRVEQALRSDRVDRRDPVYTAHRIAPGGRTVIDAEAQMIRLHDAAAVLRAHPDYAAPRAKTQAIRALLRSGKFPLLD
ncbi:RNA polymerase sigma factor [Nocardia goodfellowii]|uniref:RNA polymerase sigma factor (Sigma-70 family) n=1 Tax=Nocardia goodfellowii TaxID=882446 RepID=A0ABS4QRW8_9NOCA|nr:RNA polymerase sigma factor [Nocardia goodfellowii]MBP2194459.1 RNA polymerase sigma factor (sigma-70 family) [Nocardia goodfellowii]